MNSLSENHKYEHFLLLRNHLNSSIFYILGFLGITLLCAITYLLKVEWLGLAFAGAIGGVALIVHKPEYWLYLFAGSMRFLLYDEEDGFSIMELTLGLFFLLTILFWFFWFVVVKRQKVIKNNGDILLLSFIFLLPFTSIISVLNGVSFIQWLRECHHYAFLLFYFPMREYLTDKRKIITFLILLGAAFTSLSIQNIIAYKRATSDAVYAYQLIFAKSAARVSGLFFPICTAISLVALSYLKNNYIRILVAFFAIVNSVAALASMSRTTWILVILSCIVPFFIARKGNRFFYGSAFLAISASLFLGVMLYGGKNVDIIKKIIDKRLSSAGKFNDYSYLTRVNENIVAWDLIQQHPLGGSGTGAKKLHYDLVLKEHSWSSYIHNGYISMIYKFGFPLALLHFAFFISYSITAFSTAYKYDNPFTRALALGCLSALVVYYIYNIFGCVFDTRQGIFTTFLIIGFINIAQTMGKQSFQNSIPKELSNG